jgi:hypothetical protein
VPMPAVSSLNTNSPRKHAAITPACKHGIEPLEPHCHQRCDRNLRRIHASKIAKGKCLRERRLTVGKLD